VKRSDDWAHRWEGFGRPETQRERDEQERSMRDALAFVRDGRHVEIELTRDWVEHPVTGEPVEVLGWNWPPAEGPDTPWCGEPINRNGGPRYGGWLEYCERPAGWGTDHAGIGACHRHERRLGQGTGAWIVAHAFARALECTPWEGLLWAVKLSAGKVAFIEAKLGTADCDEDLEPQGRLYYWVRMSETERDKLARVSKLAIEAGVAERLVKQIELEAQLMLRATTMMMDELGLPEDQRELALGIMSRNLLALEAEQTGAVRSEDVR
jgi:hypothetical protein